MYVIKHFVKHGATLPKPCYIKCSVSNSYWLCIFGGFWCMFEVRVKCLVWKLEMYFSNPECCLPACVKVMEYRNSLSLSLRLNLFPRKVINCSNVHLQGTSVVVFYKFQKMNCKVFFTLVLHALIERITKTEVKYEMDLNMHILGNFRAPSKTSMVAQMWRLIHVPSC